MHSLWQDLRYGTRMLLKRPGFTLIVVITLALGIGANSALFSVINAVLLRPLPFHNPEHLVTLWESNPRQGYEQNAPAAGNFADWRDQNRVFAQTAVYHALRKFSLAQEDQPERIAGAAVSASLFEVLGVAPARGRGFLPEEEQPGRDQVTVISHGLWQRRFAADPNLIGKAITLDRKSYNVIGVMPEGFQFPGGSGTVLRIYTRLLAELWVPLALNANQWRERSNHYLNVIARFKPGITIEQAQTEMDAIQQRLEVQYPDDGIGSHVKLVPLSEQVVGTARRALLVLWGAVAFVLLIGCTNVANLLLSRAAWRKKEMAVRAALGASRARVIRQLLTESLLLSLAGGIGGILLATWGVEALSAVIPDNFPRREEIAIDQWVLGFTVLISVVCGVIFGLAPALQSTKTDLTEALKEGGRSSSDSARHDRVRSLLVITETALALVLLIGAALMIQSFLRLQRVNPGFNSDHVLTTQVSLPPAQYAPARRYAFFQQLIERCKALPGVLTVAAGKHLPLSGDNMNFAFDVEGRPFPPGKSPGADCRFVTTDYFRVLGIPLVKGRTFGESDGPDAPHVLVINEAATRRFFPNEDPIGKRVRLGINNFSGEIVGVVGDVKHRALDAEVREEVYTAYSQAAFWTEMMLVVRASGDPMSLAGPVRNEIRVLDKEASISKVRSLRSILVDSVAQPRFRTLLLALFGVAALMLASVGIYGVMSYAVTQRTREIGVRVALGARASDVLKLVVTQGMKLAVIGVVIGVVAAIALTRVMTSLLFGIGATDPLTFIVIALLLTAVALLACWIPARRATKLDPILALRCE